MNRKQRRTAAKRASTGVANARPRAADVGLRRGLDLYQGGQFAEAGRELRKLLQTRPDQPDALHLLGVIEHAAGRDEAALPLLERAVAARPGDASFHNNLGAVCKTLGRTREAIAHYQRAVDEDPGYAVAHNGLGAAYLDLDEVAKARSHLERALAIDPTLAMADVNLATLFERAGDPGEAIRRYRRVIDADRVPADSYPQLANNMGLSLQSVGSPREAEQWFRRAIEQRPDFTAAHSNLLLCLNYSARDPEEVFAEHRRWAEQQTAAIDHMPARGLDAAGLEPERRLRVGYATPDLGAHSVGYFIRPLLAAHDRSRVEVTTYTWSPGGVASWLRDDADRWRDTTELRDDQFAALVREDQIDILVDLAGHTAHHRLGVLARRPAPVQVAYLGYPNTTGLDAIDYRVVDEWTDPTGATEHLHTETLVRLPGGFLCYQPPLDAPEPGEPPSVANGYIIFGSFNHLPKMTPQVVETWAGILRTMPDARFVMKNLAFKDGSVRERVLDEFARNGVDAGRVELIAWTASYEEHLALYSKVDIALDTFPYGGHTTTCEGLWMGVPVVTLAGRTYAGRVTVSLLSIIGLSDLVAADADRYVEIATALARDGDRLTQLRRSLRPAMAASPLCDPSRIAREMEDAYRTMWRRYLERAEAA